ncbi:MAG: methylenetetrahydrofolate--tRNA-(uracil(54)-C(5))-methyltransferase (FADH(2)-oxidizing) TrmFO [Anaerolineales bacterium]
MPSSDVVVVGGGLAGCEAAWQAAERGLQVQLHEMRPLRMTAAHRTDRLAELVCSNSLGSALPNRAGGLLKAELQEMGSLLLQVARETSVPAGGALAVDRVAFAEGVTARIQGHPRIEVVREEVTEIPSTPAIVASGPLTSPALSDAIARLTGTAHLYFFDAVAPMVSAESIDTQVAFRDSRRSLSFDYLNCPLDREQYYDFVAELKEAERIPLREYEEALCSGVRAGAEEYFEGCLPVEILAERGVDTLAFGPMRPVGLQDPRTWKRPFAVVQLRQDDRAGSLYNLVGFQTNLKYPEQRRVLRLIPGLEKAEFMRYGQMHRNTFVNSPRLLHPTLQLKTRPDLFLAGQLTGVEGYMGNVATGLLAGWNAARLLSGEPLLELPATTMLGALCRYITSAEEKHFQPMKANFGLLPPLENPPRAKLERGAALAARAVKQLRDYIADQEGALALPLTPASSV